MKKVPNAYGLKAIEETTGRNTTITSLWTSIKIFMFLPLLLLALQTRAQEGIAPPTANIRTAPAGSLVIAMDNVLQAKGNGDFNLKTYGLIVTLLNNQKKIHWVIRAGKAKDAIDFSAPAERVYPSFQSSSTRNFIGGPFVIYAQDTAGVGQIINTFNSVFPVADRVKIYRLTSSALVDIRYDLNNTIKVGIMDEGGAYGVHEENMEDASIPTTNYEATNRFTLNNSCYTFVSEPHNGSAGPWVDSVKRYVLRGGNFLAQCAAIISYEEHAPAGGFQTTGGFDNVNENINAEVIFPQPDLSFIQVHGLVEPTQGGNTQTYALNPGSTTKNDFSAVTKGSVNHPEVYGASISDLLPNQTGGLVFYLGNHDYKDDDPEGINGIRMYFSAMLTPSSHELCPSNNNPDPTYNSDINVTYVNVPVPGNVQTNDVVPSGTNYGTPVPLGGNPPSGSITMNTDGTYSFVSPNVGVYRYNVPVCVPGQASPCPMTLLTITVLGPNSNNNPPVANTDIATTRVNTAVTLRSLSNDRAGNPGGTLNPGSVTITVNPMHGTAVVNAATGDITYTPANGYTGKDTLTYRVCDNSTPTALCATALQIITINAGGIPNSTAAADDYVYTAVNTAVTGNAMTNDTDPEGNLQSITPQTTTIAGKGTLVLSSNGSFTFTPVAGFIGPVSFPYSTTDNGAPAATANATIYVLVSPNSPVYNPDINVTYVNVPVPGNVQTNDVVPSGTAYGTPVPLAGNPAGGSITMNTDGTYSFVSPNVGVYRYNVPVCVPGQAAPCPVTLLTITVLGPNSNNNPPVANTDIATTRVNTPVTLKSLANDYAGNVGGLLNPASVFVTVNPRNGTYTVNNTNGDITYTPAAGFSGMDTLTYRVCDNSTPIALCATALQIITIKPAGAPNSTAAADDYVFTPINTVVTGNAMTNDTDPEGNSQSITAQTTTIAGKGTLVLNSNGTFTFTPIAGFSGPVNFPYTTTDNGTPAASANATIYILVSPAQSATNPDFNSTFVNVPVPGNVSTNDRVPAGTSYGTSPTLLSSPAGSAPSIAMNANGTYTFVSNIKGVYVYDVPVCMPGQTAPCPPTKLTITVLDATVVTNSPVANVDIAVTRTNTPVTLKTLANDAAGNAANSLVPASVTITSAPLHGTATVNTTTGDITYTPAAGYTGTDTLRYQVCDDQVPSKCASANQIISIRPLGAPNTTEAADDYKITNINTVATGNVKINDNDPEGNTQTVTAQNTTIAGKGNLVLNANGDYTFTPVTGFTGPVDYVYTTCDNGVPQACAMATLHILVRPLTPVPDLTPNITTIPNIILDTMNFNVVVRVQELDAAPTNGSEILVRIIKDSRVTFTYNPALTSIGFSTVQNNVWTYDGSDPFFHIFRTNTIIAANGSSTFGFVANFNPGGKSRGKYTMTASLNSGSGGETKTNNNQDAEVLDYLFR